jgi:hypothetical protein
VDLGKAQTVTVYNYDCGLMCDVWILEVGLEHDVMSRLWLWSCGDGLCMFSCMRPAHGVVVTMTVLLPASSNTKTRSDTKTRMSVLEVR